MVRVLCKIARLYSFATLFFTQNFYCTFFPSCNSFLIHSAKPSNHGTGKRDALLLPCSAVTPQIKDSISQDIDESCIPTILRQALLKTKSLISPNPDSLPKTPDVDVFLARFFKDCSNSCTVAPSTISGAGLGLFCNKKSIKQGTILTLYPVHVLGVEYDNDDLGESSPTVVVSLDDEDESFTGSIRNEEMSKKNENDDFLLYILGSRPLLGSHVIRDNQGTIFCDVNPDYPTDSGWLAHLVNDGATVQSNSESGLLSYYESTARARNCALVPFGPAPIMALVATRKIRKGEELFHTYGCMFWLERLLAQEGGICTDITEAIQQQVQLASKESFRAMQSSLLTQQSVATALQEKFGDA